MKATKVYGFLLVGIMAFMAACKGDGNNRNEENNSPSESMEMIAGDGQKSWRMKKEVSPTGETNRANGEEKEDEINFHTNNTFSLVDKSGTSTGKWSYDGSSTLTLQFDGDTKTESFTVKDLSKNKMRLVGVDGSEMVLVEK